MKMILNESLAVLKTGEGMPGSLREGYKDDRGFNT